ncbi:MAG: DUF4041 domain-containing protein [Planctomycetes bacterium]|nr:DUF4041 domain-containing protein [Planctomycetota bacterium]
MTRRLRFNPPPNWPKPPEGWVPPRGWVPPQSWPDPPSGWVLWLPDGRDDGAAAGSPSPQQPQEDGVSRGDREHPQEVAAGTEAADESRGLSAPTVLLDDERVLQEVGIYRYHHPLENATAYKSRLSELGERIASLVKTGGAIEMSNLFTFDNSLAKGRRMCSDLGKLMLRAYNAEVENCLRTLRVGNVVTAKARIEASRSAIKKLGKMMEMQISDAFHALRIEELELTADYLMKKQEEREAAREERERLREERKVEAELAAERERLDKERAHIVNALDSLRAQGTTDVELEKKLAELDDAVAQNDYRTANIRAGYVYVISNRGAFGRSVVKIGLTRRLTPMDRVRELGDASVPFHFDVHGLFFSEDAVTLEAELHKHFDERRVNVANTRREFFFASPTEVRQVLESKIGAMLEFNEEADSTEYHQSVKYWPEGIRHAQMRS